MRLRLFGGVLVAALILSACASASQQTTPTLFELPTAAPEDQSATLPSPTAAAEAGTSEPAPEASIEAPAEAVTIPGKREAPMAVDASFHNDSAALVGATGNPQLLEFFTFW